MNFDAFVFIVYHESRYLSSSVKWVNLLLKSQTPLALCGKVEAPSKKSWESLEDLMQFLKWQGIVIPFWRFDLYFVFVRVLVVVIFHRLHEDKCILFGRDEVLEWDACVFIYIFFAGMFGGEVIFVSWFKRYYWLRKPGSAFKVSEDHGKCHIP